MHIAKHERPRGDFTPSLAHLQLCTELVRSVSHELSFTEIECDDSSNSPYLRIEVGASDSFLRLVLNQGGARCK